MERPRVVFCGMRSLLEDPAEAGLFICRGCSHEWVGKSGDTDCPLCGSDTAVLMSSDMPQTNAHRSPV